MKLTARARLQRLAGSRGASYSAISGVMVLNGAPPVKPPPWICRMTGSLVPAGMFFGEWMKYLCVGAGRRLREAGTQGAARPGGGSWARISRVVGGVRGAGALRVRRVVFAIHECTGCVLARGLLRLSGGRQDAQRRQHHLCVAIFQVNGMGQSVSEPSAINGGQGLCSAQDFIPLDTTPEAAKSTRPDSVLLPPDSQRGEGHEARHVRADRRHRRTDEICSSGRDQGDRCAQRG